MITKSPVNYRGDFEIKYIVSNSSLVQYDLSVRDEEIDTRDAIFSNQENDFNSTLSSNDSFYKQTLVFTKKLSDTKAWQVSGHSSTNSIKQSYSINPSLLNDMANNDLQNIRFEKKHFELKSRLLASRKKDKYSLAIGAILTEEPFDSNLSNQSGAILTPVDDGSNTLKYTRKSIYHLGSYNWKLDALRVSLNYALRFMYQGLDNLLDQSSDASNYFIFEPSLNLQYRLNPDSYLMGNFGFNQSTNPTRHLFTKTVLINNRSVITNEPNLSIQKNQSIGLSYNKNDLFNQAQMILGVNYLKQKGNFFSRSFVDSNAATLEYFFLPEGIESIDFNFGYSKFLSFLETNFKLNSFYAISNYKNIVNNSDLRSNKAKTFSNLFFLKTSFDLSLNFENEMRYDYNNTTNESSFSNRSFKNKFKLLYKPVDQFYATFSIDYFIPDLENTSANYSFIDANVMYKPKNKNWEINLTGTNLANETNIEQIQNTDISTNIYRNNLLNRYILLSFYYNF